MKGLILLISVAFLSPSSWNTQEYSNYNFNSFFQRKDVNSKIDLKNMDKDLLEAAIFFASNEVRKKKRKKEFQFDSILLKAARSHSDAMNKGDFFNHTNKKNRKFRTTLDRIERAGGGFIAMAENIAKVNVYALGKKGTYFVNEKGNKVNAEGKPIQTKTYKQLAQDVLDKWMNSKGHKRNLMADHSYLGCGISDITFNKRGIPELLLTQNFGEK